VRESRFASLGGGAGKRGSGECASFPPLTLLVALSLIFGHRGGALHDWESRPLSSFVLLGGTFVFLVGLHWSFSWVLCCLFLLLLLLGFGILVCLGSDLDLPPRTVDRRAQNTEK
jgi:hypothetical protein